MQIHQPPARNYVQNHFNLIAHTLRAGGSIGVPVAGNSQNNETTEWLYLLLQEVGAAIPEACILHALWDDTPKEFGAWTTVQAGTAGPRHIVFGVNGTASAGRFIYQTEIPDYDGSNISLAFDTAPTTWTGANRTIVSHYGGSNVRGFRFTKDSSGRLVFSYSTSGLDADLLTTTSSVLTGVTNAEFKFVRADRTTVSTAKFTGSITGNVLTVSSFESGAPLDVGQQIGCGPSITANTTITALGTGTGGVGTYTVSATPDLTSRSIGVGSSTVTLYVSDDGVAWTSVGTTTTTNDGGLPIFRPPSINITIGARSGAEYFLGRIREALIRTTYAGPVINPQPISAWRQGSATPGTGDNNTLGGSPTLYVLNGSVSGWKISDFADASRVNKLVRPFFPAVDMVCIGNNDHLLAHGPLITAADSLMAARDLRMPNNTRIIIGSPIPTIVDGWTDDQAIRSDFVRVYAQKRGFGIADPEFFLKQSGFAAAALREADGLHMNALGNRIFANGLHRQVMN